MIIFINVGHATEEQWLFHREKASLPQQSYSVFIIVARDNLRSIVDLTWSQSLEKTQTKFRRDSEFLAENTRMKIQYEDKIDHKLEEEFKIKSVYGEKKRKMEDSLE